jgi:hypothetical protein
MKRFAWLALLLAFALWYAVRPSSAQAPEFQLSEQTWFSSQPAPRADSVLPSQTDPLSHTLYLPLIVENGPQAKVRFGTALVDKALEGEASSFSYGVTNLAYLIELPAGVEFLELREVWSFNGVEQPNLGRARIIPSGVSSVGSAIALTSNNALPAGEYSLEVWIGGQRAGKASTEIQP